MPVGGSREAADESGRGRRLPLVLAAAAGLLLALLVLRRTAPAKASWPSCPRATASR